MGTKQYPGKRFLCAGASAGVEKVLATTDRQHWSRVQFTSADWTDVLTEHQIAISMDGRGRDFDNIFVERLWRSLKYEQVYLHEYRSVTDAWRGISEYFSFYNDQHPHSSFENQPPAAVYYRTLQNSNERQRGKTEGFSRSFWRNIYI
jgi:transposase InsO family protein